MTRADNQESRAMRQLAGGAVALESPEDAAKRRARVVPKLAAAIEKAARIETRRRRLRLAFGVMAAAAVLLLTLGLGWAGWYRSDAPHTEMVSLGARVEAVEGAVTLIHEGTETPAGAKPLVGDDQVRTDPDGLAVLMLASGTKVTLAASTVVKMGSTASGGESTQEEVRLSAGRIEAQVPKLGPAGSFEVVTADARVCVHGTRFSVEVGEREGTGWTHVEVTEGLVAVHHEGGVAMLGVGASWSSASEPDTSSSNPTTPTDAAASARAPAATATAAVAAPPAATTTTSSKSTTTPAKSSLAAENALFQAAMRAARQGDDERALALLNEFLAKYPSSPLAQNVRVERFRALARLGRDKAASAEARRYMAEHPDGFASDEARDIVMPPASSSRNGSR